jgi:hypothetical protein
MIRAMLLEAQESGNHGPMQLLAATNADGTLH